MVEYETRERQQKQLRKVFNRKVSRSLPRYSRFTAFNLNNLFNEFRHLLISAEFH